MSSSSAPNDTSFGVSKLSLQPSDSKKTTAKPNPKAKAKAKSQEIADSWEDEDVSSGSDTETGSAQLFEGHTNGTAAPPPTPVAPTYVQSPPSSGFAANSRTAPAPDLAGGSPSPRPEKTDAVARRMIAGALGLRAPKLTDEQKAYQKAVQEKERKRKEEERAAAKRREEEAAKAKAAIWDD